MQTADETVIVIDNALTEPQVLRQLALQANYPTLDQPHYHSGRNSERRFQLEGMDGFISHLTGQQVAPDFSSVHAKFRICTEGEEGSGGVHVDLCHWTGILYLTLPEHCKGGTSFLRHRASGQTRSPVYPEDWEKWGGIERDKLSHEVMIQDGKDMSKWEVTQRVDMKFNRLVLFRSWLWHMAEPGFGSTLEDGRLVYLMVYKVPGWE